MTAVIMAVLQAGAVPVIFSSKPILSAVEKESIAAAATHDADDAIAHGLGVHESIGAASDDDGNAAAAEKPIHSSSTTHRHPQTTPTRQVKPGETSLNLLGAC